MPDEDQTPRPATITAPEDIAAIAQIIGELSATNDARIAELATQGIQITPLGLLQARIEAMLEWLIGPRDSGERMTFELHLQKRYNEQLDKIEDQAAQQLAEAQAEARKAALVQGVNLTPAARQAAREAAGQKLVMPGT
jgi:hypothetical protein